jgi:tetratricopeptide (TPR) repeat protein
MWTLLGILALILIAAASAAAGYRSGILQRQRAEATQVAGSLQTQYELALQEMEAGQYNRAKQRLEYIIKINPGYPGVTEKLADVLLSANSTATPTIAPTPTLTPTPDTRGVDEKFSQAQQLLTNGDWSGTIETLLNLRKADPNFQPVVIDGMLYTALRNRGRDKILQSSDLEGGIYDLTLAERFGPIDVDSKSYQTWAELYLRGASFWELDWSQAVYYFAQVAPAMPNLRDGSGLTATERYRQSLAGYGETFAKEEDWCNAAAQYEAALAVGTDEKLQAKYDEAVQKCEGGDDEEEESDVPAATESPIVTPSETAPVDVTPAPTEITPEAPPATEAPIATEAPPSTEAPVEPTVEEPSATPSP